MAVFRLGILVIAATTVSPATAKELPRLTAAGRYVVDESGAKVILKGCNLGSWLLIEPWMLGVGDRYRDEYSLVKTLQSRFGPERAAQLIEIYRENWIGQRELDQVKAFGFNVVRVPFHHSLLAGDDQPPTLRPDAFKWLDRAIDMAERAGVYVILDLHGAPGGQSVDAPTGRVDVNALWKDAANQDRTVWLWQRIAERYRERSAVVAYDLINEPWGDFRVDVRPQLLGLVERIYAAIREVDPAKLIFAPGSLRGFTFYGDPRDRGWKHVGFTEHFYPGLHGQGAPALETHARFLAYTVPGRRRLLDPLDTPYLVGEFNAVLDRVGRPELMRRYYDDFGAAGWLATMWTLRMVSPAGGVQPDNWYLVTNAEPFTLPDLNTATDEEIERAFRRLGSMELAADEKLRTALTAREASPLPLAEFADRPTVPPPGDAITGWADRDVAATLPGGVKSLPGGAVVVFGAGSDLWGDRDEFHFLHQEVSGDFAVRNRLRSFEVPHTFAKAGWMLRESAAPDAAHVLVHAFTDGRVMLAWRAQRGGLTRERTLAITGIPVGFGLERKGRAITVCYTDADGQWHQEPAPDDLRLPDQALLGLVVMSHEETALAAATFDGLGSSDRPSAAAGQEGANLLRNPSFEAGPEGSSGVDRAEGWDRWGPWFNREQDWKPQRDGRCLLGYHHWQVESAEQSGVYQDVTGLRPGSRCTFSVYANRDAIAAGKHGPDSVEVRIESRCDGRLLTVASQTYAASDLATGEQWSRLEVAGSLPADNARVLIIANPSREMPRDAALKFDMASLRVLPQSAAPVSVLSKPGSQ